MSRGNQETRKRKRKERKKRKAMQRRADKALLKRTAVVNEWRSCSQCQTSFFAVHAQDQRCPACAKKVKGYSFERAKREALRKHRENQEVSNNLDRRQAVKLRELIN